MDRAKAINRAPSIQRETPMRNSSDAIDRLHNRIGLSFAALALTALPALGALAGCDSPAHGVRNARGVVVYEDGSTCDDRASVAQGGRHCPGSD